MKKIPTKFEDLMKIQHRWPRKGDRLLRPSNNWLKGVKFSHRPISRHAILWDGYMSAGAGLIELCTQDGYSHYRDVVIYPILFNYRHGLELAMKWIVIFYSGQGISGIEENHDLWKLWQKCRHIIEQYVSDDSENIEFVEKIVKDFHDLDKAGITFRYGWSKDGKEIKLPDHVIDLENIRDVMEGVANYFNALDAYLQSFEFAGSE